MTRIRTRPEPMPAESHQGLRGVGAIDAVWMLTVYLILLIALPSNLAITALGAYGRPQFLWGLVLFAWWVVVRLQTPSVAVRPIRQPLKVALGILIVVALLGFAQALLRGQPFDQISPSISALLRLASWTGVALVAMDGIRTVNDLSRMARRIALAAGALAALGILQFLTGTTIVDAFTSLPGFTGGVAGIDERGGFTRASGTATHPLEYATALSIGFPLAIATAVNAATRPGRSARDRAMWLVVALIAVASFIAVSRSAVIGFVVAVIATIPAVPRRWRLAVVLAGLVLAAGTALAVPGLYGTIVGMFLWFGTDPSSQSRIAGLEFATRLVSESPLFGSGIGTFLPRYYIFDNQWAQLTVEMGIAGVLAFAVLFATAVWSAGTAGALSPFEDIRVLGRALAASMVVAAVLYALFDGLAFPISSGLAFLILGLCGAARLVGVTDRRLDDALRRVA
ncbi:O-antigen ligase family protein [Microbacterium allomyrinae]|uniref:O-antigen ligase family protein n=1 Tax=Microbacterium allomyrinae TaxID=2830666 RepID=A0A9X1LWP2_9MICO|nr:O-antigen ligase family protein [Microbacterium allomyrinae]MCC2033023.1 O-antigen ligase family protein [Microbacterium allomyrinae]